MEKRKEERRKEMERRRLEREREKTERTKLSSPKRIPETSVIPDEVSDHEDFEPWEDVEETQNSPRSDVTVSRVGFRVKVLPAVETRNSWFWRNTLPLRSRGVVYQTEKRWTYVVTVLFHCWFRVQAQKCDHLSSPFLSQTNAVYICRQNQMARVPLFEFAEYLFR